MSISPRENMLLVYQHKRPEYMPLYSDIQLIRTVEPGYRSTVYDMKPTSTESEVDWFGQKWIFEPKIKAFNPDVKNYVLQDISRWQSEITFPDLDAVDWENLFERDALKKDPNKLHCVKDGNGLWERALAIAPMEELMCGIIEEPEESFDLFRRIADHKIKLHNLYIEKYKPDVLCMHDDYGFGGNLFMAPETWRELIKPNLQRVIDNITSQGVMYEHHCCGYMASLAEEICDMGATSWHTIHVSNDPAACKRKFGNKLALIAGLCDGQYMDSDSTTEEQLREHIRKVTNEILPGVGAVIHFRFSNHPERTEAYMDELIKCGEVHFGCPRPESW